LFGDDSAASKQPTPSKIPSAVSSTKDPVPTTSTKAPLSKSSPFDDDDDLFGDGFGKKEAPKPAPTKTEANKKADPLSLFDSGSETKKTVVSKAPAAAPAKAAASKAASFEVDIFGDNEIPKKEAPKAVSVKVEEKKDSTSTIEPPKKSDAPPSQPTKTAPPKKIETSFDDFDDIFGDSPAPAAKTSKAPTPKSEPPKEAEKKAPAASTETKTTKVTPKSNAPILDDLDDIFGDSSSTSTKSTPVKTVQKSVDVTPVKSEVKATEKAPAKPAPTKSSGSVKVVDEPNIFDDLF
jgi:hypothetical protein